MDEVALRAWWFCKQGLDGSLIGQSPRDILTKTGWSRSVGGANPYLAFYARGKCDRSDIDQAIADVSINELPSARGCTYVVPEPHFGLAVTVGRGFGDEATIATAIRFCGVTQQEIEELADLVCPALASGPMDPRELKKALGDAVRNLGDEGKKRGMTTTLPMALGLLQSQGRIRRVPVNGRIDNQRYKYAAWNLETSPLSQNDAYKKLAELYFEWTGPASLKSFQSFSGLGVAVTKEAVANLGLVPISPDSDLLILPSELESCLAFKAPKYPMYAFLGSIDNLTHLRLSLAKMLDPADAEIMVPSENKMLNATGLSELHSHGIYDCGRLIGVWDFDPEAQEIVWATWVEKDKDLIKAKDDTEAFVRDQLGDARTFSLDSPESRKPRIALLRGMAK